LKENEIGYRSTNYIVKLSNHLLDEEKEKKLEQAQYFNSYKKILQELLNEENERKKLGLSNTFEFAVYEELLKIFKDKESKDESNLSKEEMTPEENMEAAYETIQEKFKDELLSAVIKSSPKFFEKLVVDLLVTMGYGG